VHSIHTLARMKELSALPTALPVETMIDTMVEFLRLSQHHVPPTQVGSATSTYVLPFVNGEEGQMFISGNGRENHGSL
jgi:hypothetical protein